MKSVRSYIKKAGIAITALAIALAMGGSDVQAVGIYIDERANPGIQENQTASGQAVGVIEDGAQAAENQNQEGTVSGSSIVSGAASEGSTEGAVSLPQSENPAVQPEKESKSAGDKPYLLGLNELVSGTKNAQEMIATQNLRADAATRSAETLDITAGTITFYAGGKYKQEKNGVLVGANNVGSADEQFTIIGTSTGDNIVVEEGANPTLTLQNVTINLESANVLSGMHIKPGASVNLILEGDSYIEGSKGSTAIAAEAGSALTMKGNGLLTVVGGSGGAGIGGRGLSQGGSFAVMEKTAKLQVYGEGLSINMTKVPTFVKIVRGTINAAAVPNEAGLEIVVENRYNIAGDTYKFTMPKSRYAFAVTTNTEGGEYVSYLKSQAKQNELLAQKDGLHVYSLMSGSQMASLGGLEKKEVTYTVTYNPNGGKFDSPADANLSGVAYKSTLTTPVEPKRADRAAPYVTSYTFEGWYKDSTAKEAWNFEGGSESPGIVVSDMTLYANWIPSNCYVTFQNPDKGEAQTKLYQYNALITDVPAFTQTGKKFDGWYTEQGRKGVKWDLQNDKLTQDVMNLFAGWVSECTIIYDKNTTHTVDKMPSSDVRYEGEQITNPTPTKDKEPTREAFTFTGWYSDKECTKLWNFGNDTIPVGSGKSITLYAGWASTTTEVTFTVNPEAEQKEGVEPSKVAVIYPNPIPQPTATKESRAGEKPTDFALEGWYEDAEYTKKWDFTTSLVSLTGEFKMYGKFNQKTCYATLKPNDAEVTEDDRVVSLNYKSTLEGVSNINGTFTKKGYTITKWTTPDGKEWKIDTPLTADIELLANWTPATYEVTFETPEGAPAISAAQKKQSVVYNRAVTQPSYPIGDNAWPGHTFNGWYSEKDGEQVKWNFSNEPGANLIESDLTLMANWTEDQYTVSFETYEGDPNPPKPIENVLYGKTIEEQTVSREHYEFEGWYTDKEYTTKWDFAKDTVKQNMTLYAKWIGEVCTLKISVQYENEPPAHTGESVEVKLENVRYGDSLTKKQLEPENQEATKKRDGYTLNGWYTGTEYTEEQIWNFTEQKVEGNTTLYAYWSWDEYTVNYYTYEGDLNPVAPQTNIRYGAKITKPQDPVREHYTFAGWNVEPDDPKSPQWDFKNDKATGNMTLYAKWEPVSYRLSFQTNGGTKLSSAVIPYGSHVDPAALKTKKDGYSLENWYRDSNLNSVFLPASDLVDQDMTIYAKWSPLQYRVRFHYMESQDGEEQEVIEYENVYRYGDYLAKPDKVMPHKYLSSWFKDKQYQEKWLFKRDQVKSEIDLYAYWSDTKYVVHFETYDGTVIENTEMIWGEQPVRPEDPIRTGFTFTGWYKDKEATVPWDFEEDFVEGETIIYSGWENNKYTLTIEVEGREPESREVAYGEFLTEPEKPVKEGYTFTGWYKDKEATVPWDFKKDFVEGETHIYAGWEKNMYTVTFDADGGEPVPKSQQIAFGELVAVPEVPVKAGHTFTGWFKDEEATVPWDFEKDVVGSETYIYAGWEKNIYTVTFDADGGEPEPEPQEVVFEEFVAEPEEEPVKEGFTFTGWKASAPAGAANWDFEKDTVSDNITLTAQWKANESGGTGDGTGGNNTGGTGDTTTGGTGNSANTGTTDGTNSGTTAADGTATKSATESATEQLASAAGQLAKILTGDQAPVVYLLAGIIASTVVAIWMIIRKLK